MVEIEQVLLSVEIVRGADDGHSRQLARAVLGRRKCGGGEIQRRGIGHEQVQVPIVVDVSERASHAPFGRRADGTGNARLARDFCKAAPIVPVELVCPVVGNKRIRIAIPVVIADHTPAGPVRVAQAEVRGDLLGGAVTTTPEHVVTGRLACPVARLGRSVLEIDIQESVTVEVEEAGALAVHVEQRFSHGIA